MKLNYLAVHRMPGFKHQGFIYKEEHLAPGLNIVVGPNGSGKTTSCIAIRGLLWPNTLKGNSPVSLQSSWTHHGEVLELSVEGCHRQTTPPAAEKVIFKSLPPERHARCYTITVDDLFTSSDLDFATEIAREASGGYDLQALYESPKFAIKSSQGRKEKNELDNAQRDLRTIQNAQRVLNEKEASLHTIITQIDNARRAKELLVPLHDAIKSKQITQELQAAEAYLKTFPKGLESLRADDEETYDQLEKRSNKMQLDLDKSAAVIHDLNENLQKNAFASQLIPSEDLIQAYFQQLADLKELENKELLSKKACEQAELQLQNSCHFLTINPSDLDGLNIDEIGVLKQWWQKKEQAQVELHEYETRLTLLEITPKYGESSQIREAIRLLNQWLHVSAFAPHKKNPYLLFYLSLFTTFTACFLAYLIPGVWGSLSLIMVLLSGGLSSYVMWQQIMHKDSLDCRTIENSYHALHFAELASWSVENVRKKIEELEMQWGQLLRYQIDVGISEDLQQRKKLLEERLRTDQQQFREVSTQIGFASPEHFHRFAHFVENFKEAHTLHFKIKQIQHEVAVLSHQKSQLFTQIADFISLYDPQYFVTSTQLFDQLNALRKRVHHYMRLENDIQHQLEKQKNTHELFAEIVEEKHLFMLRTGTTQREDLLSRLSKRQEYMKCLTTYQELNRDLYQLNQQVEKYPQLVGKSFTDLESDLIVQKALSQQFEELLIQQEAIKNEVELARKACPLESAQATVMQKEEQLRVRFEESCFAAIGHLLINDVEQQYHRDAQPIIFSQADKWFTQFSHGEYSLRLPERLEEGFSFLAHESRTNETKPLESLSRGTRMQLLLAVRLAFSSLHEDPHCPMPFFFDEVLSSSDPVRFHTIAASLLEMANAGRQLFYFTCQPADAEAWKHIAALKENVAVHVIDLAKIKNEHVLESALSQEYTKIDPVLAPRRDITLEEYQSELAIPGISLDLPVEDVSIAHLLSSAQQLYFCRLMHVHNYGQVKSLVRLGSLPFLGEGEKWSPILAKGHLLERYFALRQVGKGQMITKEVLEAAGISDKFISGVSSIAKELTGNALRLVEVLEERKDERLKGFRKGNGEQVKQYLIAEGYMDVRPALSDDEIRLELLQLAQSKEQEGVVTAEDILQFINRLLNLSRSVNLSRGVNSHMPENF